MIRMDLNLLIVLDALLEECSVSKAASRLNVTPPAVSKSLNKIRDIFLDKMLVRSGTVLLPTPLAEKLKPQLRELMINIEDLLNRNTGFDIDNVSSVFKVASNDLIISLLSYHVLKQDGDNDSSVIMDFIYDGESREFLRQDGVDMYIGESREFSPEIKVRTIYRSKSLVIARKGHAVTEVDKTIENMSAFNFITTKGRQNDQVDAFFSAQGFPRRVVGACPSYFSTIESLLQSDSLAVVPGLFLRTLSRMNVDVIAFELEQALPPVKIIQAWHPRFDNFPPHQWLREYTKTFFTLNQT